MCRNVSRKSQILLSPLQKKGKKLCQANQVSFILSDSKRAEGTVPTFEKFKLVNLFTCESFRHSGEQTQLQSKRIKFIIQNNNLYNEKPSDGNRIHVCIYLNTF